MNMFINKDANINLNCLSVMGCRYLFDITGCVLSDAVTVGGGEGEFGFSLHAHDASLVPPLLLLSG